MTTKDTLVAAACSLLDEGGPEHVTLREVGRRAGVSHNAPYKHFADKQALLTAVAVRELSSLSALMPDIAEVSEPPIDRLRRSLSEYTRWALAHPARFHLVFGEWSTDSPELGEAAGATWGFLIGLVVAAQRAGELPGGDPERLAALIQALAHGAITLTLTGHLSKSGKGGVAPEDLVADLLDHLRLK